MAVAWTEFSFRRNSKGDAARYEVENCSGRCERNRARPVLNLSRWHRLLAIGPTVDEIRQRAYELHLEHGCAHGRDHDDWLEAERDLIEKYQAR